MSNSEAKIRDKIRKIEELYQKGAISREIYLEIRRNLNEELKRLKTSSHPYRETEEKLSYSEVVYIKAEEFVGKPRIFSMTRAPCANNKIKKDEFAASVLLAALTHLHSQRLISFSERERKVLMGLRKIQELTVTSISRHGTHGLEGAINRYAASQGNPSLKDLVEYIAGGSSPDPFEPVLTHIKRGLSQKGLAYKKGRIIKKYKINCEKALPLAPHNYVAKIKNSMETLKLKIPSLYPIIYNTLCLLIDTSDFGPD